MQPNSKLLINYGIVDENNPHDRLPLSSEWLLYGTGGGCGGGDVCGCWWLQMLSPFEVEDGQDSWLVRNSMALIVLPALVYRPAVPQSPSPRRIPCTA